MRLILLPGMDGTGRLFEPFLQALPVWLVPSVVEYPPHEVLSSNALLEFVEARVPKAEPYALLAESFSGPVAIRIAAKAPAGLTGLIMAASFIRSPVNQWLAILRGAAPLIFASAPPAIAIRRALAGNDASDALVSAVSEAMKRVDARVMSERLRQILQTDVSVDAARTTVPILYLQAERDRLVRPRSEQALRAVRPDLMTQSFDAPHLLLQRRPHETASAVAAFVQET
jgi:pimeloyl-ACP methyl ester carboxylesterase